VYTGVGLFGGALYQLLTLHIITLWQTTGGSARSRVARAGAVPLLDAGQPALQGANGLTQLALRLPGLAHPLPQVLLGKVVGLFPHLPAPHVLPLVVLLARVHPGLQLALELGHLPHHLLHLLLPPLGSQLKAAHF